MRPVRLILAERNPALRRVLRTGLMMSDFQVYTAPSVETALDASARTGASAALLDAGLVGGDFPEFDPLVTVVIMSDGPLLDAPCLWIRKPFDPALLAAFLNRRYRRDLPARDCRRHCREPISGRADVVVARTGAFHQAGLLNVSKGGCALLLTAGAEPGDTVWLRLRVCETGIVCMAEVTNARLVITPSGELQRAVGMKVIR